MHDVRRHDDIELDLGPRRNRRFLRQAAGDEGIPVPHRGGRFSFALADRWIRQKVVPMLKSMRQPSGNSIDLVLDHSMV